MHQSAILATQLNLRSKLRNHLDPIRDAGDITDRHRMVLRGIETHKTIRQIAKNCFCTHGWIHKLMKQLEEYGAIENKFPHKRKARTLTDKGKEILDGINFRDPPIHTGN